jgi:putative tricarboxylic transport membrane protein
MKKITVVTAFLFIALSIGVFCVAWTYPGESNGAPGPGFFPMILSGIVFLLSVLLLINIRKENAAPIGLFARKNALVLLALLITVVYIVMIMILGFPFSTVLYLFGLMKFFKVNGRIFPALISVCTAGILYGVFTTFLSVQLPRGIFF